MSTLFWCNVAIGATLGALCLAAAPFVTAFYNDPRTSLVIAALAPAFVLNATGVQHLALLQRDLRYVTLAVIEVGSEVVAATVSISMALAGFGYWAIVAALIVGPAVITIGAWVTSGWRPGLPRRNAEVYPMLRFGGAMMIYGLLVYVVYNVDKILIGRYYGSGALGLYGKAYELIHLPTRIISTAIGMVAFSSLARLQSEPARLKNYFLKGYALYSAIILPATVGCVVFASDVILVMLGPKWIEATTVFQLLAPSVVVLGLVYPLGWLLMALGLQERNLKISLALAPLILCSYLVGLPYGPSGVALAFSVAMTVWLVPYVVLALRGTMVSVRDLLAAIGRPLAAIIVAAGAALSLEPFIISISSPFLRLALGGAVMMGVYALVLLFVLKQSEFYFGLLRSLVSGLFNARRVDIAGARFSEQQ